MACWHSKYTYLFWRPLTAIRNADIDGNPNTESDPAWAPLVTHPNHPGWPSAPGCVSGSLSQVLSEVLGTNNIDVNVWGAENGATTLTTSRHFDTVDAYRDQVETARVWAGFHYRSAVKAGLKLGARVAHWDLAHAFRPIRRPLARCERMRLWRPFSACSTTIRWTATRPRTHATTSR